MEELANSYSNQDQNNRNQQQYNQYQQQQYYVNHHQQYQQATQFQPNIYHPTVAEELGLVACAAKKYNTANATVTTTSPPLAVSPELPTAQLSSSSNSSLPERGNHTNNIFLHKTVANLPEESAMVVNTDVVLPETFAEAGGDKDQQEGLATTATAAAVVADGVTDSNRASSPMDAEESHCEMAAFVSPQLLEIQVGDDPTKFSLLVQDQQPEQPTTTKTVAKSSTRKGRRNSRSGSSTDKQQSKPPQPTKRPRKSPLMSTENYTDSVTFKVLNTRTTNLRNKLVKSAKDTKRHVESYRKNPNQFVDKIRDTFKGGRTMAARRKELKRLMSTNKYNKYFGHFMWHENFVQEMLDVAHCFNRSNNNVQLVLRHAITDLARLSYDGHTIPIHNLVGELKARMESHAIIAQPELKHTTIMYNLNFFSSMETLKTLVICEMGNSYIAGHFCDGKLLLGQDFPLFEAEMTAQFDGRRVSSFYKTVATFYMLDYIYANKHRELGDEANFGHHFDPKTDIIVSRMAKIMDTHSQRAAHRILQKYLLDAYADLAKEWYHIYVDNAANSGDGPLLGWDFVTVWNRFMLHIGTKYADRPLFVRFSQNYFIYEEMSDGDQLLAKYHELATDEALDNFNCRMRAAGWLEMHWLLTSLGVSVATDWQFQQIIDQSKSIGFDLDTYTKDLELFYQQFVDVNKKTVQDKRINNLKNTKRSTTVETKDTPSGSADKSKKTVTSAAKATTPKATTKNTTPTPKATTKTPKTPKEPKTPKAATTKTPKEAKASTTTEVATSKAAAATKKPKAAAAAATKQSKKMKTTGRSKLSKEALNGAATTAELIDSLPPFDEDEEDEFSSSFSMLPSPVPVSNKTIVMPPQPSLKKPLPVARKQPKPSAVSLAVKADDNNDDDEISVPPTAKRQRKRKNDDAVAEHRKATTIDSSDDDDNDDDDVGPLPAKVLKRRPEATTPKPVVTEASTSSEPTTPKTATVASSKGKNRAGKKPIVLCT